MNQITVKSLPLYEVIRDIAEALDTSYEENCGEYYVSIPDHCGTGTIRGINFHGGFGLIIYECTFHEDMEIHFIVSKIHPLKFLFCLSGGLLHRFEDESSYNEIDQYQSSIVASRSYNGHILQFKGNQKIKVSSLEIDREKFQEKMDCELRNLDPKLKELFMDSKASNPFYYAGFYSLQIADLFRKIDTFENNDFIRRIFLEGKAYQILTYLVLQYHDDLKDAGKRSLLREHEINLIEKVAGKIDMNLSQPETIDSLAEEIGLNVNKLQEGFKYLYGSTVNNYIQKSRLGLAKHLLISTQLNISEIVEKIGLSSKSYFSKVFKEQYGITPSEFRQKNRNLIRSK
ncbi:MULTISPECIES: AraC family transcriptional regulator [Altibacter]|uniref:helix-turn-helix domain-containing protein n=1 Tax=Altibacter TaxID=1535231 RepID=UPI0005560D96|nr:MULTISPECIES: AraC family transcriptional regulator [Altibacter]MCW8980508.1 AraC family transcriptional regulator [Altibacter sp.]MCW9038692.1 AraC family transcriptional regulator [Altibacter sp.]